LKIDTEIIDAAIKNDPRASEYATTSKDKVSNQKFHVTWEVNYFDDDVKYSVSEIEEAKNLEELIEHLDAGKEEGYFTPELKVPPHDGDFNIEYVLIESDAGDILWKDPSIL